MKYLIIGNGVAGVDAALAIRKNDPDGEIKIISKSGHLHYFRPKLIDYLAGEIPVEKFTTYKEDFYKKNNIDNILNTEIISVETSEQCVVDSNNNKYSYDKLLIATGAQPFVPQISGITMDGVFTLRGISCVDRILNYSKDLNEIAVIGGGLLGLETANSLASQEKKISVIEFAEWLLPRQLDRDGGDQLKAILESKGIEIILNDSVQSIAGNNNTAEKIILKSGKEIPAKAVIISTGITPRIDLAKNAGINTNRGIIVDDKMKTSIDNIYAAGDAIEHDGRVYGLWLPSKEQGKIAGQNMSGSAIEYSGSIISSLLKVTGIDLYSAGNIADTDSKIYKDKDSELYKKFLLKNNEPFGAIVMGDKSIIKIAQKVMEGKAEPEEFLDLFK